MTAVYEPGPIDWSDVDAMPPPPAPLDPQDNVFEPGTEEHDEFARQVNAERKAAYDQAAADRREKLILERYEWHRADQEARRRVQADEAARNRPEPAQPLDWPTFLTQEFPPPDWHVGRILAQGQHVSLIGEGKAGKSLFALEMAWRTAAGLPFLGDARRRPRRVMYIDQENGWDDIQDRLRSLGATPEELANLIYLSFPPYRPLDTQEGAADLLADVDRFNPEVVYLDTISRMIQGDENKSDPWLGLYRHTILPLKAANRSSVRLDHFGKDVERGARGNSAKNQDVDAVWELAPTERGGTLLQLRRTHTRRGLGRGFYRIERLGEQIQDQWKPGATRHVLADGQDQDGKPEGFIVATQVAAQLDAASVPLDWSRDKVRKHMKDKIKCNNDVLGEALKIRRNRSTAASADPFEAGPFQADIEELRATIQRCPACGLLPGEDRHEINCVYGASSVEHVAALLDQPVDYVAQIRSEWEKSIA